MEVVYCMFKGSIETGCKIPTTKPRDSAIHNVVTVEPGLRLRIPGDDTGDS